MCRNKGKTRLHVFWMKKLKPRGSLLECKRSWTRDPYPQVPGTDTAPSRK